jgi:hypothetical protein
MLQADTFIANEAHWFTPDVVYLVFIRNGAVAGARVGGQILAYPNNAEVAEPTGYAKPEWLLRWAAADPLAPGFLEADRKNFFYSNGELREAHITRRRALWTGPIPNSGSVTLTPRAGRRRRLILLGDQDPRAIHSLLVSSGVPIALLGT